MKFKGKSKDPNRAEADRKRIQSMVEMKKGYKQQKTLIKEALSNVDSTTKNKIIFDYDNDCNSVCSEQIKPHENGVLEKKALFDQEDESENESYNFEVKEQFEGKKGQKLLELQSRFKKDKRFVMDERFLEDEHAEEEKSVEENNEDKSIEAEHKKQFEILEEMLGRKVTSNINNNTNKSQKCKVMLRFDPTQPEHEKFEIKESVTEKKKKRKGFNGEQEKPEEIVPEVSTEKFYQVNEGLKEVFQEKQEFSLLNMFNHQTVENNETVDENHEETISKKNAFGKDPNPFRYDSSTDDEADEESNKKDNDQTNSEPPNVAKPNLAPSRLWTESFFFKPDDYRLQEGLDFVKKMEIEELSEFSKLRRDLKQIVRSKVRNNQRKNRPFKKKLGGNRKKMIKIKKAMKR